MWTYDHPAFTADRGEASDTGATEVSQKFAGGGTVGVHGVGRERAEAGKSALPGTLAERPAHGHSRQGHVGATAERPAQRTETQSKHQERIRGPERLLRTQNGQDRHH